MNLKSASYRFLLLIGLVALLLLLADMSASAQPTAANSPKTSKIAVVNQVETGPAWTTLTDAQKDTLSPLATEWKNIDANRKQKWIEIANRYQKLNPDEKARAQERMREWVKLTPEQRMRARENFARASKLKSSQKAAQWQHYQELNEEEKKQLAAEKQKKTLTNLPATVIKLKPHTKTNPSTQPEKLNASDSNANPASNSTEKSPQPETHKDN